MPEPLTVAVAQPAIAAHGVAANARAHAAAIRGAGARVVVFPELSLTGYELDAAAVDPADPRLAPITAACAETGAVALAGAPVAGAAGAAGGPDATYIAVLAFDGDRVTVAYRKMWPMRRNCSTSGPAASPPGIGSGWRWPASPGPPAAATSRRPGAPGSGGRTAP